MNFHEFQAHRTALLAADSSLIDFGQTNIWRSLAELIPRLPDGAASKVHRCHLAQRWLELFGLPPEWAQQALVSSGVRNSLSLLFAIARHQGIHLRIPIDVYPVYGELARAAGISFETFCTLPELLLPDSGDWLLIPNPLKPAGRWLASAEVADLKEWLSVSPSRRVLLDAVYTFDSELHPTTMELVETGQAIVLHSLSKGWLHPQVFGIALIPESDQETLSPTFREYSPPQDNLWKASCLLNTHPECPQEVASALTIRRNRVVKILAKMNLPIAQMAKVEQAGYMIPISISAEKLLENEKVLAIPLAVFGSPRNDISVVSTLQATSVRIDPANTR